MKGQTCPHCHRYRTIGSGGHLISHRIGRGQPMCPGSLMDPKDIPRLPKGAHTPAKPTAMSRGTFGARINPGYAPKRLKPAQIEWFATRMAGV